jgi:hypothetical protein
VEDPVSRIISLGTRKIPLPMIVPTTIAVAWLAPSTRGKSPGTCFGCMEDGWLMR